MKCNFLFLLIVLGLTQTGAVFSQSQKSPAILPAVPSVSAGYHIFSHSHNDYEHAHPLMDALDNRFYSIEADIWLKDGEILVSHSVGSSKGSLKQLYLDPLQKRVDEKGSVYGDKETVYLWLDLKEGRSELRPALHHLLKQYSMITRFTDSRIIPGAVTAILTGDAESKTAYGNEFSERMACRDSNDYTPADPPADHRWRAYALKWSSYIQWNGKGIIPEAEYKKLVAIVSDIHAKGRKVRFYATPETKAYWELALKLGLDWLNTDLLSDLNEFLQNYRP